MFGPEMKLVDWSIISGRPSRRTQEYFPAEDARHMGTVHHRAGSIFFKVFEV